MKYLSGLAAVASLVNAVVAASKGEYGFALALFGGVGAWTLVAARQWGYAS